MLRPAYGPIPRCWNEELPVFLPAFGAVPELDVCPIPVPTSTDVQALIRMRRPTDGNRKHELHVGVPATIIAIPHLNIGAHRRPPSGDIDALRHMR